MCVAQFYAEVPAAAYAAMPFATRMATVDHFIFEQVCVCVCACHVRARVFVVFVRMCVCPFAGTHTVNVRR